MNITPNNTQSELEAKLVEMGLISAKIKTAEEIADDLCRSCSQSCSESCSGCSGGSGCGGGIIHKNVGGMINS